MNNSNSSINCIQINLQRSKTSTANLLKTIEEYNIDIVIAQEPHVINGKVIGFPLNYSVLYDQNSTHPDSYNYYKQFNTKYFYSNFF
jgi:hypothetical protein